MQKMKLPTLALDANSPALSLGLGQVRKGWTIENFRIPPPKLNLPPRWAMSQLCLKHIRRSLSFRDRLEIDIKSYFLIGQLHVIQIINQSASWLILNFTFLFRSTKQDARRMRTLYLGTVLNTYRRFNIVIFVFSPRTFSKFNLNTPRYCLNYAEIC